MFFYWLKTCDIKLEISITHLNESETLISVMSELFFCEGFSLGHVIITTIIMEYFGDSPEHELHAHSLTWARAGNFSNLCRSQKDTKGQDGAISRYWQWTSWKIHWVHTIKFTLVSLMKYIILHCYFDVDNHCEVVTSQCALKERRIQMRRSCDVIRCML